MEYFINGEIYLKRGPKVYSSKDSLNEVLDKISDLEFDISKENPDFSKADALEGYAELADKIKNWDGELDYYGTNKFWEVFANSDNKIKLIMVDRFNPLEMLFNNINELNSSFIKLSDFLEKSIFVGRKFRRTKPIVDFLGNLDIGYTNVGEGADSQFIVLYATQDLFLVRQISENFGDKFILINSRYTIDGNYEFFGEVHEEYRDKAKLYDSILEQINEESKNRHL